MNENSKPQTITTIVDSELWKEVGMLAVKKGITRKDIIESALLQYCRTEKKEGVN